MLAGVLTSIAAGLCLLLVVLMLLFLLWYTWPAIRYNGLSILNDITWNIGNQYGTGSSVHNGVSAEPGAEFGGLVFLVGTMLSALLAMVFAVPLALGVALTIVYRLPERLRLPVNALIELMAGIPSVVYGLWGTIVLVPWVGNKVAPFVTNHLGFIPFLGGDAGSGNGLFAAAIVLAIMVMPIMVATVRDVLLAQPKSIYEASMALGSTSWQAVTHAVLPSVRTGIVGAILVAFGRALGETMAVLMVAGNAINILPHNIFSPINTIAAVVVSQLESAVSDASGVAQRSLAELALVLFVISLAVNTIARVAIRGQDRSH